MDPPPEGESGEDGNQPQPEEESNLPSFVSDGLQAVTDMVPKESDLPEFVVEGLAIATSVVAAVSTVGVTSPVEEQQNVKGLQERLRAAGGKLREGMKPIGKKVQRGMRITGKKVRAGMKNTGVKVRAGAKLAGGKLRAGLKTTGGKVRAGLKTTGGKVRAGLKTTGGKVRAGMNAVGTKVKGRLQKLPGQMKAGGVQAKEKYQAFRANVKVRGAQAKVKYQEFRETVKVRSAQAKVKYHAFREGVKAKTAQTKVKYQAVRENVKVKAGQARVRFKSFQADAKTKRSSLLTQFMYDCHTMKLQCLVCWGIENPKLVMAGIKRRESGCTALVPTGYGVLLHKALVLTTCEYVSDSKKALVGEVLLNYGNIRAHSPSLSCVPTQAEIAKGLANRPQRSNSAPGSRSESKAVSKPVSRSRSAKSMSRGGSRTQSPAHSGASTPSRTPKRPPHTHKLLPSRIFMTNRGLDLTLVACDPVPSIMVPLGLGLGQNKRNLDVDRHVYILGHTRSGKTHSPLKIGRGRVVECDPMFVKFATETETWVPGCAGFDERGNFAFFVCNPQRVPFTKPASMGADVGSDKKRVRTHNKETVEHVGVMVQGIRRWVSQHWDGDPFDLMVPSLGSHAPSREPIPDSYDSQTQPSAKQKWLESYNSAPTYAELALFLDVYDRLATFKRECHNADKERMSWLPKELPGPSREIVQQKVDRSPSAIARRASAAIRHALAHRHGHIHEEHYQPRKRKRKKWLR